MQTDVRMNTERDLHAWFRYLWETYKMILDTLRNNKKLEDTYLAGFRLCLGRHHFGAKII